MAHFNESDTFLVQFIEILLFKLKKNFLTFDLLLAAGKPTFTGMNESFDVTTRQVAKLALGDNGLVHQVELISYVDRFKTADPQKIIFGEHHSICASDVIHQMILF